MSEEMRQIFEKMQELMDEMDPEKIQEQLQDMELSQDAMEKELDRALEQFRQLEWETNIQTPSKSSRSWRKSKKRWQRTRSLACKTPSR